MLRDFALEEGGGGVGKEVLIVIFLYSIIREIIGTSLAEMRESLKNVSEEARIRNWTNKGSAEFGDILRKYKKNIEELSDHVITFMVNYLSANQGSIFILDEDENGEEALKLTATYCVRTERNS